VTTKNTGKYDNIGDKKKQSCNTYMEINVDSSEPAPPPPKKKKQPINSLFYENVTWEGIIKKQN
jgi:hypothetical protein